MLPGFLKFPICALDISDESYKYLQLRSNGKGTEVAAYGEGKIPRGIVEKGEIKREEALSNVLKELFQGKKIKYVAVSLPEDLGYFRTIKIEGVKEEEIKEAVELQLEEYVPLPPSEVVFDFNIVDKNKNNFTVFLRAFPRVVVETYLGVIARAGALPTFVESEVYSLYRCAVPFSVKDPIMIVDWGKTKISFSVAEGGSLRFVTTAAIGGRDLDSVIARTLKIDIKKAEELKETKGFMQSEDSHDVFQAIVPVVSSVVSEMGKYISYYETHSGSGNKIVKIILAGGDVNLLGFREHVSRELKLKVEMANPWTNVNFPQYYLPKIVFKDSVRYSTVIGLALGASDSIKYL